MIACARTRGAPGAPGGGAAARRVPALTRGAPRRNNSLFDFVEQMNHPSLKYAAVIFNRVRCNADYQPDEENPDRAEFKIASSETTLRDQLARQFTTRIRNDHQVCLMRELPGRLLNMMMTQKRPIVSIENTPQVRDTLNAANKNLATIAAKVFG